MITVDSIIEAARSALGTPFRHQGRLVGQGLDCAGLIVYVASVIGVEYSDVKAYGRNPHAGLLKQTLDSNQCIEPVAEYKRGDILLMRFTNEPQHLAIHAGESIIHSYSNVGAVCEHTLSRAWLSRIVCAYRFKDVA